MYITNRKNHSTSPGCTPISFHHMTSGGVGRYGSAKVPSERKRFDDCQWTHKSKRWKNKARSNHDVLQTAYADIRKSSSRMESTVFEKRPKEQNAFLGDCYLLPVVVGCAHHQNWRVLQREHLYGKSASGFILLGPPRRSWQIKLKTPINWDRKYLEIMPTQNHKGKLLQTHATFERM